MQIALGNVGAIAKLEFNDSEPGYTDGFNDGYSDANNDCIHLEDIKTSLGAYDIAYLAGYVAGIRQLCRVI